MELEVKLVSLPGLDQRRALEVAQRAANSAFVIKVFSLMTQVFGSGFRVPEGLVTAKHVIAPALVEGTADLVPGTVIKVAPVRSPTEGREAGLDFVAADYDLAALEDPFGANPLPWGDFASLKEGDPVIVIAAPQTIEEGVTLYAGLGQILNLSTITPAVFRYSIPVQPGSSGGAVLNLDGEVVGINLLQERYNSHIVGEGLRADVVRKVLHGEPIEWGEFKILESRFSWVELATFGGAFALGVALFSRR